MTYKITTPGPPEKQAFPIALKVPPPMMAAIPKNVKSLTVSTLFKPECSPSPPCCKMVEVGFLLNKLDNDITNRLKFSKKQI
jgi:hypothetical protein